MNYCMNLNSFNALKETDDDSSDDPDEAKQHEHEHAHEHAHEHEHEPAPVVKFSSFHSFTKRNMFCNNC